MGNPTIVKRVVDVDDFRRDYQVIMTNAGLSVSLVQRVCNLLVNNLNNPGLMNFASSEFVALVSSATLRQELKTKLEAAVILDYDYYSNSVKVANTNVSIDLAKENPTVPLNVIYAVANAAMTSLSGTRDIRSRNGDVEAAIVAAVAAALAAGATQEIAEDLARKAAEKAQAGFKSSSSFPPVIIDVIANTTVTSPAARNVTTFSGSDVVLLRIPYNRQISEFTEEVTFSDGSKKTSTTSIPLMPSAEPSGFVGDNKSDIPAYLAVAVVIAKKNKNVAAINALGNAIQVYASTSDEASTEVALVLDQVEEESDTTSNSGANFTLVSTERRKYIVFVVDKTIPVALSVIKAGERYEFPDNAIVQYAGVTIRVGKKADGDAILLFNNNEVPNNSLIPGTNVRARIGSLILESVGNTFPAMVNPYRAIGNVFIYKRESVELLAAGEALPLANRVSWAPDGAPAGSLLRDLGRSIVVANANGAHVYHFRNVQWINGASTEGVGGSIADVDEWRTGWICTWADSGEPFSSL